MTLPSPDPAGLADERRWRALLEWLKGHRMLVDSEHLLVQRRTTTASGAGNGLFATTDVPRQAPLFTLPGSAKLNARTLAHYPNSKQLTATQLIALHLLLFRPTVGKESDDRLFGPYISILPRDFGSHPLTWIVHRTLGAASREESTLLDLLPPSTLAALGSLEERFWKDWGTVRLYLDGSPEVIAPRHRAREESEWTLNFMWAWLNVNTRCLYDDLGLDKENNISLCPIFDLANHAWAQPTMEPVRTAESEVWDGPSSGDKDNSDLVCVSHNTGIEQDQEVTLKYGWHPNRTLFVEYGFVNSISAGAEEIGAGTYPGEIEVQDIIEGMLERRGKAGAFMKRTLSAEGYWGDWTLHSTPIPGQASFRLITALRLYHVFSSGWDGEVRTEEDMSAASRRWRETIMGQEEVVSEANERACAESIRAICAETLRRAEEGMSAVDEAMRLGGDERYLSAWRSVRMLWAEERSVAAALLTAPSPIM
ncbi:hypothetical protein BC834DRAFT_966115 [Gloeopeniophorella convolvens]|nr:hypothetical protein BC834DRAFT_966115 [Gloeopeniophorella convolvens]